MAALQSWWRTPLYIVAIAVAAHAPSLGQPPREILNSERIAAMFGNYGIEVLEQDDAVRVSNLYSEAAGGEKTCRTFAVVQYRDIADELRTEHDAIMAGGSIGAVLTAAGWEVRKTHLRYETLGATPRLAALMQVAADTPLAAHVYALDVVRPGRTLAYAALVEIHHPDYLGRADLLEIYGPADETARPGVVAATLATAAAAAQR